MMVISEISNIYNRRVSFKGLPFSLPQETYSVLPLAARKPRLEPLTAYRAHRLCRFRSATLSNRFATSHHYRRCRNCISHPLVWCSTCFLPSAHLSPPLVNKPHTLIKWLVFEYAIWPQTSQILRWLKCQSEVGTSSPDQHCFGAGAGSMVCRSLKRLGLSERCRTAAEVHA